MNNLLELQLFFVSLELLCVRHLPLNWGSGHNFAWPLVLRLLLGHLLRGRGHLIGEPAWPKLVISDLNVSSCPVVWYIGIFNLLMYV